jgi:hypothetical protein
VWKDVRNSGRMRRVPVEWSECGGRWRTLRLASWLLARFEWCEERRSAESREREGREVELG